MSSKKQLKSDIAKESLRQWNNSIENHSEEDERRITDCIERGDEEGLEALFSGAGEGNLKYPLVLDDEKKNLEYDCVVAIALMTKAAVKGGLDFEESLLVSDVYFKKVAASKNVSELREIYHEAAIYIAGLVNEAKHRKNENPTVFLCKKYIAANRTKKISLQDVASHAGVSDTYLCHLFKEHEGCGVTEYILREKIDAACNMLKFSKYSVSVIADYLGFSSLSYFSRLFTKRVGISPVKYRNRQMLR